MSKYLKTFILGEVCKVINGRAYKQDELLEKGKYRVLRVGNFFSNNSWYYSDLELDEDKYCEKSDLLYAWSASFGPRIWDKERVIYHYHIWKLIPDSKTVDKRYLYFYLLNRTNSMIGSTHGSIMLHITKSFMEAMPIHLPSLNYQQKIASALSTLDYKIELNNRINAELEQMAKTLYDYWFVQFDFPNAKGKPYKASGGKMVYNEVLKREIPEGWEVKSLYKIADYINGLACQKYRPENDTDDFLPVIKIREMGGGISENTEKVKLDIPEKNKINDGDVLFSWSATLDIKIWVGGKGALNQHIFKVVSKEYPRSFYYFEILNYLHHFKMMAELRKTTMGHITIDHLKTSFISVPPKDLIEVLDRKLNPIFSKIITNQKQNQDLAALRDWLLPMLMNGQAKVQ